MYLISDKKIRMFELLDKQILSCTDCDLYKNGRAKPYWTPMSIFMMVGEAPGADEIEKNEPFVGKAGKILIDALEQCGLRKELFGVINSVNCRPVTSSGSNGKPTQLQLDTCRKWIRKFSKILQPEKVMTLGNYAMNTMGGAGAGITGKSSYVTNLYEPFYKTIIMYCIHPAYVIYNRKHGQKLLEDSIKIFANLY